MSQDVPPLYADYFDLKATKTLGAEEKLLPTPFNYLGEFKLGALPIVRDYQR